MKNLRRQATCPANATCQSVELSCLLALVHDKVTHIAPNLLVAGTTHWLDLVVGMRAAPCEGVARIPDRRGENVSTSVQSSSYPLHVYTVVDSRIASESVALVPDSFSSFSAFNDNVNRHAKDMLIVGETSALPSDTSLLIPHGCVA